jgi:ABC-type branched-subunit amino acid transport system substrate-binding protein
VTRLRLGACLSLSGRYARFGRQAATGLKAWQSLTDQQVDLELEDDGSNPDCLAARLPRLAPRCDLLLGPYSTQLMRAAGRVMADLDTVLWNHGGSGDDVQALCPGRIVSVLAPTSRYAEPFVRTRAAEAVRVPLWVVRGRGRFGRQVAAGALRQAAQLGVEALERTTAEALSFEEVPEAWDLFCAGTFEDDVAIVNEARSAARPARALCSIAAGVRDFAAMIDRPDGMYGIAQWFPGRTANLELGPPEGDFVAAYAHRADALPDYPAVQAAAAATLAVHCAHAAGGVDRSGLWAAAASLDTTTLLGEFRIDPETGVQTKHTPVLLRWHARQLRLIA